MPRTTTRWALAALLLVALCGAPTAALAQPRAAAEASAELRSLAAEVRALELAAVDNDRLGWLIEAQARAEALGNRGARGADAVVREVVLLRQLAQLQDERVVELRGRGGEVVGVDRAAEAARVREALSALRAGERWSPVPEGPREAPERGSTGPGEPERVRDLLNREVSFIEFNRRLLSMARDGGTPPLERLRFLTIVSSNLDEFFKIRVAGLQEEVRLGRTAPRSDGYSPEETLREVRAEARDLVAEQYRILNQEVLPALRAEGVRVLESTRVAEPEVRAWARDAFASEVRPALEVLPLGPGRPFPRLADGSLNLLVTLGDGSRRVVQVPRSVPALLEVPNRAGQTRFLPVERLVAERAGELFPGQRVRSVEPFRVTRNADLWGRTGVAASYGEASRLEVGSGTSSETRRYLARALGVSAPDVYAVEGPLDATRLGAVADVERPDLRFERHTGVRPAALPEGASVFEAVGRGDVLMHHPFHAYDPVVDMLREAARDGAVESIRHTLYRTGGADSSIVEALVEAARAGKDVTVLVETRARFDERNNSETIERLRAAGARVVFGPPGLKTHGKMLLVTRREGGELRRYAHLGTGNYNPGTARFYTDFSLMTRDPRLTGDLERIFETVAEGRSGSAPELEALRMAPYDLKSTLLERIAAEAEAARAGRPARIVAKMNSLNDPELIRALYAASQAGVEIDLIVRGISTLRPGVPGLSENIRVRSVVGQFLEHTRVFRFHDGGRSTTYLGSADWMVRNTERRVEVAFPVEDPRLRAELGEVLELYLRDSRGAFELRPDGRYARVEPGLGEARFSAQEEMVRRVREAELARLDPYRRGDGTLDWSRLRESRVLREAGGLAHFGLALFLKELAVVLATGDRLRIEEFVDGLLTTDFYVHYGLFVAGARLTEVAYSRYLERFVRPQALNGLLKTSLVLGAGLALPMIWEGHFTGRGFVISLGSLGLSSAAVRAGLRGISWVTDLTRARGLATRLRVPARLLRLGSWVYTAAELAVVLYVAETLEREVHELLDRRAARARLAEAGAALTRAVLAEGEEPLAEPLAAYQEAWTAYRDLLYRELHLDEARLQERMREVARLALLAEDVRRQALTRLEAAPAALRETILARYDSIEEYADARAAEHEAEARQLAERALAAYQRDRDEHLRAVYEDDVRGTPLAAHLDPARLTPRAVAAVHADASGNRLETYRDEEEVLELLLAAAAGDAAREGALTLALRRARELAAMDRRVYEGGPAEEGAGPSAEEGPALGAPAEGPGLTETLEEAGSPR